MAPLQYSREVMTADGTIVSRLMFHFVGNGGLYWLFEWRKRSGDPKDKRQERQGPLFFVSGRLSSRLGRLWEKVHAKAWETAVKERRRKQRECRGKVHSNHNDESWSHDESWNRIGDGDQNTMVEAREEEVDQK
jgi:hypothetical protein